MEVVLPQPRNIAVIASLVALCCAAIAIPVAAQGNAGTTETAAPLVPQELLDAREHVDAVNTAALETAPPAAGNRCDETIEVAGIGSACRTPSGLLRVEQPDGSTSTIHGLDAVPLGAAAYAPGPQARANNAGPADIDCVADTAFHYTLVYARPANVTSRFATIAPKLRTEAYKISAFIDAESQSVDPKAGRHLPFACDGGAPRVLNAQLATAGAGVVFEDVVNDLKAQGYAFNSANSSERYLLYVDAPSAAGAGVAGTGHVSNNDDRPDELNMNNKGGLYAMQYNYANGGDAPHWEVMVHELSHTMGAVADSAPHASGYGHCNDGLDVMCYADGGPTSRYGESSCSTKVLDCNRDDYFNPAPAPGSYLANHWNMAGAANRWLVPRSAGDQVPPIAPTGLTQTGASNTALGVSWTPASDNVGVTGYDVAIRTAGGAWRTALTTARRTATIMPLNASTTYEVSVTARDAAGNVGPAAVITGTTNDRPDSTPPSAPTNVAVRTDLKARTVTFTWNESTDDIGVASYEVHRLDLVKKGSTKRAVRGAVRTVETTYALRSTSLKPGTAYLYEIVARDPAGNTSRGTKKTVAIRQDKLRPTAPGRLRGSAATSSSVQLTWNPSSDNVGVKGYRIYQKSGRAWVRIGTFKPSVTSLRVNRLRAHSSYAFHVEAFDAAGNARPSRTLTVRTR
ncbi:MAG: Chitinase precursor [Thermoleophilia bacterium]|nr:Chitinase precursor [Thermoleophilia bacterium]